MQINFRSFYNYKKNLKVHLLRCGLKTYNNTKVRAGQKISNPRQHAWLCKTCRDNNTKTSR